MVAAGKRMTALATALGLLASSSAAAASNNAPSSATEASNAWLVLTDLSASQTARHDCRKNYDQNESKHRCKAPPPPLLPESAGGMANGTTPIFVMGLWWGLIALALASGDNHDRANSPG